MLSDLIIHEGLIYFEMCFSDIRCATSDRYNCSHLCSLIPLNIDATIGMQVFLDDFNNFLRILYYCLVIDI